MSVHKVTSNFADFGLESSQVEMVKGWFHDRSPSLAHKCMRGFRFRWLGVSF